ncbi:hypothetical protein DL769_001336 [Monosporascus sp. CRB-8-3]|nr:hypothetical protein DL769_001336 [Monosporascus sp. CRB-8-3]
MAEKMEPKHMPKTAPETPTDAKANKIQQTRFWIIIFSLSLLAFISALDVMIITTALPTIVAEIGGTSQFVWIANSFVIASCVLQPLIGQLANILGRKTPTVVSVAAFIVGSTMAGSANGPDLLIAGRTIQGVGAGGMYVLIDIVCCDLVPLRERGKYLGIVNSTAAIAAAIGPVIGGVMAASNWRWIFYMNIPICAVPFVALLLFMRMKKAESGNQPKLRQIDFIGNVLFIPSMVAVIFGLVTGGIEFPWSSWRVILPLVIGAVGWIAFHIHQHFAIYPSVPSRLFGNRTSAAAFALTFLTSVITQAISYFLPVYFQSLQGNTVDRSGVNFLPLAIGTLVSAVVAGVLLSRFGTYRFMHAVSFACSILACGLLTTLDGNTPTVAWAFFELIAAAGAGIPVSTLLPAIMAALPESDVAASTAAFSFIKTFGYIWGVTIPSVVFNAVVNNNLGIVTSTEVRDQLANGGAYSFASRAHHLERVLDASLWSQVETVFVRGLDAIWWFSLAVAIIGLFTVGLERRLELRTELDTEYGLDDARPKAATAGADRVEAA